MATKEHKRHAKGLIEQLESRIHSGPPIGNGEIVSAREFLRQTEFAPNSEYYSRLGEIQSRLVTRCDAAPAMPAKRNYGGEADGYQMQLQSIYDHVIVSTCYGGEFNLKRGRIKISHRFNLEGRIDFVELKFLRSLEPCLTGEIRKLLMVKAYQNTRKDWCAAEGFVLPVLPQELIFLYADIFRCPREEVLAWLINIGHRMVEGLWNELRHGRPNEPERDCSANGDQLSLRAVREDQVAFPIVEKVAALEATVEPRDEKLVLVRVCRK
jgi:hypothetical protein